MGSSELKLRQNWQSLSGLKSAAAEQDFFSTMDLLFEDTEYIITSRPNEFARIYENWPLSDVDSKAIYNPDREYRHGFHPDYSITNSVSKKKIFVEIKRQDGWVEGLPRNAGRGNAHERLCKYFTPGLLKILSNESKIEKGLPFWIVFIGNITRDPCRVREVTCWFDSYTDHFLFWRDENPDALCSHFIDKIANLLD